MHTLVFVVILIATLLAIGLWAGRFILRDVRRIRAGQPPLSLFFLVFFW